MKRMFLVVPCLGLLLGCQSSGPVHEPRGVPGPEASTRHTSASDLPDFSSQERYLVPVEFLEGPGQRPEPKAAPLDGAGQARPQTEPPRPGLAWVPPHRIWRHGEWVSVPGQWLRPPQGATTYVLGHRKEIAPQRYIWVDGHWR